MEQGVVQTLQLPEAELITNAVLEQPAPVEPTEPEAQAIEALAVSEETLLMNLFMGERRPRSSRPFGYAGGTVGYF